MNKVPNECVWATHAQMLPATVTSVNPDARSDITVMTSSARYPDGKTYKGIDPQPLEQYHGPANRHGADDVQAGEGRTGARAGAGA